MLRKQHQETRKQRNNERNNIKRTVLVQKYSTFSKNCESVCLSVCMSVCLLACLSVCLPLPLSLFSVSLLSVSLSLSLCLSVSLSLFSSESMVLIRFYSSVRGKEVFSCPQERCGYVAGRDTLAARNIFAEIPDSFLLCL